MIGRLLLSSRWGSPSRRDALIRSDLSASAARKSFLNACGLPLVLLPSLILCLYASLVFLPESFIGPGLLHYNQNGTISVCPRRTICSEGPVQLILIAISRLSAYTLYISLVLAMLSKCYCSVHFLSSTMLAVWLPFQWVHELHVVAGKIVFWASIVHTLPHLARWGLRAGSDEIIEMSLVHKTGASGLAALLLLIVAVLPMWRLKCVQRCCNASFERRHWMHLCAIGMFVALLWHHPNLRVFCMAVLLIWGCDRVYLVLTKTRRVDEVSFMRLDDGSVQMHWRNPPGVHFKAGEYVRVMVPAISTELHPFSVFEYDPSTDIQLRQGGGRSPSSSSPSPTKKARASNFKSVTHMILADKKNKPQQLPRQALVMNGHGENGSDIDIERADRESSKESPSCVQSFRSSVTSRAIHNEERIALMLEGLNGRQQQRNEGTHSQILISPAGDWTRALSNSVDEWSHKGTWVAPCWVQGPFLSPFNAAVGFGHLVVVTSGIGMSAAMPLVLQLSSCEREVLLCWMSRSLEQLTYQLSQLKQCTCAILYYTGNDPITPEVQELFDAHPHIKLQRGRPNLEKLLAWLMLNSSPSIAQLYRMRASATSERRVSSGQSNPRRSCSSIAQCATTDLSSFVLPNDFDTAMNAIDARLVQSLMAEFLDEGERTSWCVFYCGGVPKVREALMNASRSSRVYYTEESFAW